jgi:hypothetical protein
LRHAGQLPENPDENGEGMGWSLEWSALHALGGGTFAKDIIHADPILRNSTVQSAMATARALAARAFYAWHPAAQQTLGQERLRDRLSKCTPQPVQSEGGRTNTCCPAELSRSRDELENPSQNS